MLHTVCRMLISVCIRGFFIFFSKNNTPSIAHPVDMHWAFFFISIENGQKNNNKKVTNSKRRNKGKHCMNFDQLIVVVDFVGSKHRRRLVKHQKKILKKAFNKTSVIMSTSDCITTLRRQLYTNKVKQLRSRDRGEREYKHRLRSFCKRSGSCNPTLHTGSEKKKDRMAIWRRKNFTGMSKYWQSRQIKIFPS